MHPTTCESENVSIQKSENQNQPESEKEHSEFVTKTSNSINKNAIIICSLFRIERENVKSANEKGWKKEMVLELMAKKGTKKLKKVTEKEIIALVYKI